MIEIEELEAETKPRKPHLEIEELEAETKPPHKPHLEIEKLEAETNPPHSTPCQTWNNDRDWGVGGRHDTTTITQHKLVQLTTWEMKTMEWRSGDKLNKMYKTYSHESRTDLDICDAGDKFNNMYKTYSQESHTDLEICELESIVSHNCCCKMSETLTNWNP